MGKLDRLLLVHRLREVVVQVGFRRFEASPPDMDGELDIGAELIWGNREVESGADGDLRRIHTTVKYSF